MNTKILLGGVAVALLLAASGPALAVAINDPPPAGPVLLDLATFGSGLVPHSYTQYTTTFIATGTSTDLSFAFREDPAFLSLDDVSLTTGGGGNLVTNGGFESGPVGANAPTGWTYLNVFGAGAAGEVLTDSPHTGLNAYTDGAIQAYDAITQHIATTSGLTYSLSFWLTDDGGLTHFSDLSTNGDTTDTGGNGIDLIVYAGQGVPTIGGVPEPATWAMMIIGIGGVGSVLRSRRHLTAATA